MTTPNTDPAIAAIEETTALVVQQATAIEITDDASYARAGAFLVGGIKAGLAAIADLFDPIDDAQKAARKVTIAQRRALEDPLKEGEKIIKRSMGGYVTEQRRVAAEAEAERLRVAREEAETRQLEEAAAMENAGHDTAAAEILAAPAVPVVVAPAPEAPKAEGTSVRMVTKFRIINPSAIGRAYLVADEKKIGQIVRAMGADAVELVGGIEVFEVPAITATRPPSA